nr:ABC transporter ATP-binding protein [Vagococcus silagei]
MITILEVKDISQHFSEKKVLEHVNFTVQKNEIVSILGPSGAGKSTLFNIIAGLLQPSSGDILLNGQSIIKSPGHVSYMLQKDLLLPYKTVGVNVALPLILKGVPKKEALVQASELLDQFGLHGISQTYPNELSGGMRQRVALLRTYLFSSELILLDEPFSALDTFTKDEIHEWYLNIHRKLNLTTIFITHDIEEAIKLSDRIYILKDHVLNEADSIVISKEKKDLEEFLLSTEYLDYKRLIMYCLNH